MRTIAVNNGNSKYKRLRVLSWDTEAVNIVGEVMYWFCSYVVQEYFDKTEAVFVK